MEALLEKMLLEPDFMLYAVLTDSNNLQRAYDCSDEDMALFDKTTQGVKQFFGITDGKEAEFENRVNTNEEFRSHFVEYANSKYTYCLINQRSVGPVAVGCVWCAGIM